MKPASSSSLYHPLDVILSAPTLVRVVRALATHGGRLSVGDIADRARITLPSVRSALRRLAQLELVESLGSGRTSLTRLRGDHPLAASLVQLFQSEREHADRLFDALRRAAFPIASTFAGLWVFGSAARGTDDPDSDIDVALVTYADTPSVAAEEYRDELARIAPDWARRVSVVTLTPIEARKAARARTKFWRDLERDAVVVDGDAPSVFSHQARPSKRRVTS